LAFYKCTALTSIALPEGLTKINSEAFCQCRLLNNVKLPSSLYILGDYAFDGCASLSSIAIPDGVTVVDTYTFYDCSNLASVTLPSSVSRIEDGAFSGCYKLTSINIPSAVTSIGWRAFADCDSLATLTLPKALREGNIDSRAFINSDNLVCEVYKNSGAHKFCEAAKKDGRLHDYHVIGTPATTPTTPTTPTKVVNITSCTIYSLDDETYTGSSVYPEPVIMDGDTELVLGKDFTLTYKNNKKIGKASVTVTGIGNYTGSKTLTFKINPKGTSLTKLSNGSKRFTAKWTKKSSVTGYQIQYSTKADFSSARRVTITKKSTYKRTFKNLKRKTVYYVRIRTYKTVSGKKYYSEWSDAKSIRTK